MSRLEPPSEPPLQDELATMARARILFAASILLDALFLGVAIPILAAFEWFRHHFHLTGLGEWFVIATEWLMTGGTFATIALYVYFDLRVAYRRLESAEQGSRHGRPPTA